MKEKEVLGLYVSDHPLLGVEGLLARMCDCSIAALGRQGPRRDVHDRRDRRRLTRRR